MSLSLAFAFFLGVLIMSVVGVVATFEADIEDNPNKKYLYAFSAIMVLSALILTAMIFWRRRSSSSSTPGPPAGYEWKAK